MASYSHTYCSKGATWPADCLFAPIVRDVDTPSVYDTPEEARQAIANGLKTPPQEYDLTMGFMNPRYVYKGIGDGRIFVATNIPDSDTIAPNIALLENVQTVDVSDNRGHIMSAADMEKCGIIKTVGGKTHIMGVYMYAKDDISWDVPDNVILSSASGSGGSGTGYITLEEAPADEPPIVDVYGSKGAPYSSQTLAMAYGTDTEDATFAKTWDEAKKAVADAPSTFDASGYESATGTKIDDLVCVGVFGFSANVGVISANDSDGASKFDSIFSANTTDKDSAGGILVQPVYNMNPSKLNSARVVGIERWNVSWDETDDGDRRANITYGTPEKPDPDEPEPGNPDKPEGGKTMTATVNLNVVDSAAKGVPTKNVYLDTSSLGASVEPATTEKAGVVKQASRVNTSTTITPDADAAAGATPTKEEFDKAVNLANACKTDLQELVQKLIVAGIIASH